ncbi:hypothetical protein [Streptomyces sp. NPDC020362]|uniref:hypothetical protein n=1 Tax=unclassified Streptomyces TaxID=2593676 RepID=UPI003409177E
MGLLRVADEHENLEGAVTVLVDGTRQSRSDPLVSDLGSASMVIGSDSYADG